MGQKRYTPEQIIGKLRQAEVCSAEGARVAEIVRELGITEQTYYRWRRECGGLKVTQAKRLKELEHENARLKRAVADLTLDKLILEEAAGRGGISRGRGEAGKPVRTLRIPAGDGTASGRGLGSEPQAGGADLAAGGPEGPEEAAEALAELFARHGAPEHLRSDNGPEFTAKVVRDWLKRVGVRTLFIAPGSPWENGYNESFNGKLKDELIQREIFYSLREAQVLVEQWRREYNTIRPHSSLGYRPPAPQAIRPARAWLRRPALQGPGQVRRVAVRLT